MIITNNLSPILLELGPLTLHWYGIFFGTGLFLAYSYGAYLFKQKGYDQSHLESLVLYLFVGIVIGARLGHVLFYSPSYFLSHPIEILKIWNGGLASHGATIGLFLSYYIWARVYKVKFAKYPDTIAMVTPIAAIFIRIGNFFNSEIYGTFTNSNYGIIFARIGDNLPRHPAQLYEAALNLIIFILFFYLNKKNANRKPLFYVFLYMLLYFGGRFFLEFWKDLHGLPDDFPLSTGQVLSLIPIVISVVYFLLLLKKDKK